MGLTFSLLIRLEILKDYIVQIEKKKHWVWNFVRDNIATMSCVIVL